MKTARRQRGKPIKAEIEILKKWEDVKVAMRNDREAFADAMRQINALLGEAMARIHAPLAPFVPEGSAFTFDVVHKDARAVIALLGHLQNACDDPEISGSGMVHALVVSMLDRLGELDISSVTETDVANSVGHRAQSLTAKKAAKKSHAGRDTLKQKARDLFLSDGPWVSIAAAADKIAPALVEIKNVSRQLATTNASRTVRGWLSEYVSADDAAKAMLTDAAQVRLKRGKK